MTAHRFTVSRETILRAQKLRREATPYEKQLWAKLNRRQLGFPFRRQHAVGPYILDFYCAPLKLCVELDGDSHGLDGAAEHDARRTDYLRARGNTVIRFPNESVKADMTAIIERILLACEEIAFRMEEG